MKCAFSAVAVVLWLVPSVALGQPVIQNTSLVRVRADNHFGVVKDNQRTPSFDLAVTDTITDTEIGTAATATTSATYDIRLTPTGARIGRGTALQVNVAGAPPGTHFARVLASNACGTSGVSNEITIPLP